MLTTPTPFPGLATHGRWRRPTGAVPGLAGRRVASPPWTRCAAPACRHSDDHAPALALMALDMLDVMRASDDVGQLGLELRVGINSGPVVAGVIGRKRFLYDLWGDAVNTASRMESHGTPGRIQITRATYELLGDGFECEPRGTIVVKGKGEMEAWYLVGRRVQPAPV